MKEAKGGEVELDRCEFGQMRGKTLTPFSDG